MPATPDRNEGKNVYSSHSYLYIQASELRQKRKKEIREEYWLERKTLSLCTDDLMKYILHT